MKSIDKEPSILFEDNHLLLLDKPAGLLSQPTDKESESAETFARNASQSRYIASLYRLDRSVSGLLLFAKSSKAAARLNDSRKNFIIKKGYLALIEGCPDESEGLFEDWIGHGNFRATEGDKHSLLTYRVLDHDANISLVEIDLLTGRYHQIRYQFAKRSMPIVGDIKYGSKINYLKNRIALHHHSLSLFHPIGKKLLLFLSEVDF